MSNLVSAGWRELRRPSQAECPKLFYNLVFVENGLELQLTDLVAIWCCSLNKQEIIHSAKSQHASIDPSQSNSQLQVLFQKLDQGLKSDDNLLYHDKDIESQVVHLRTYVDLPRPLRPLTWTFRLAPQPANDLAEHLLRPCLLEASVSKQKIESLQNVIKEKDHVLSRLFERIEATSTDLSMIFPGITGLKSRRGRVTVREAERHVPGMRQFDIQEWTSHFHTDNPYAGYDQKGINNLVRGCETCPKHTAKEHFNWLVNLPAHGSKTLKGLRSLGKIGALNNQVKDIDGSESTASEDEFERQPTPPNLRDKNGAQVSQSGSISSSTPSQKGSNSSQRDAPGHSVRSEHSTKHPRRAFLTETKSRSVQPRQSSQHEGDSNALTASETESDLEPAIEKRREVSRDNESGISPSAVTNTTETKIGYEMKRPFLEDDDESDLDLDSQPTKPARKHINRVNQPSQRSTKAPTPPIPTPSTPSRHPAKTDAHSTPQTVHQTTPRSHHTSNPSSDPSTPSKTRRLGRLGTSQSHSLSPQTQSRFFNQTQNQNSNPKLEFSPEQPLDTSPAGENITSFTSTTTDPDAEANQAKLASTSASQAEPIPEPKKPETASEAANRRRQELKRKLEPVKQERKKRKF